MAILRISFLFQFDNVKGSKKIADSKNLKSDIDKDNPYKMKVGSKKNYVHVEYNLLPNNFKYSFDVVCFGPVASIHTVSDGIYRLRTVEKNLKLWVPVFIEHYIPKLDDNTLQNLLHHTISIKISFTKKSCNHSAQHDQTTVFFLREKDALELTQFAEVFITDPNLIDEEWRVIDDSQYLIPSFVDTKKSDVVTSISHKNTTHLHKINKVIDYSSSNKEFRQNEYKPKGKGKKRKSMTFDIPGETLLTAYECEILKLLRPKQDVFLFIESTNLLTPEQKWNLSPIIFKFIKFSFLPDDILIKHNFTHIGIQCNIPNILKFTSKPKPIHNNVYINESKFVQTNLVTHNALKELFRTQKIILNVIGMKYKLHLREKKENKNKKKSKKTNTNKVERKKKKRGKINKGKKKKRKNVEEVVVASVGYCMNNLIKDHHCIFKEKGQLHNPNSFLNHIAPITNLKFIDTITMNEYATKTIESQLIPSPLTEEILLQTQSTFKIDIRLLSPHYSTHLLPNTCTYKRIFMFVHNTAVCEEIIGKIYSFNQEIIGSDNIFQYSKTEESLHGIQNLLTGFIIETNNLSIIFIEGISSGCILKLIHFISTFNYNIGRVFYNTSLNFERRLYEEFVAMGGFHTTILKKPLDQIFKYQAIYLERNMTILCWRAIKKLLLLYHADTFDAISQCKLLPTPQELQNFSLEFGTGITYCKMAPKKQLSDRNTV